MPENSHLKYRPHPFKEEGKCAETVQTDPTRLPCVELHCLSNFSFLQAASHPDELVRQAARLGYRSVAITDRHSLAGIVRAHTAAKSCNIHLIVGAEIHTEDSGRLVLLAPDAAAYARLSRLITLSRRQAPKGQFRLTLRDLRPWAQGLLALFLVPEELLLPQAGLNELKGALETLNLWQELFPERLWIALSLNCGPSDQARLRRYRWLEEHSGIPLAAARGVDAHSEERRALRDVLQAVHLGCQVRELGQKAPAAGPRVMLSPEELYLLYHEARDALKRSVEIAERCHFSLDELCYEYPREATVRNLRALTMTGAEERWPQGIPQSARDLIEHELQLIEEMQYEGYFLTVYDLVHFARSRGILCQGRGSAANSVVCYALGITAIDPDRFNLLFERFISKDRNEPPDIDVDFEHERREEVIQYIFDRYGRSRAAMAATVISYRGRSAVRDVGRALGLALDQTERLAKNLHYWDGSDLADERIREAGLDPSDPLLRRVMTLVKELVGFPRHLSQHVGGMIITQGRLDELCPIENARMKDRTVLQWDKDDLDALGILKIDCLSLGMLTAVRKAFDLIAQHSGKRYDLAGIPAEVPAVYSMASRADTIGVFQIESRAQMAMLPRFKPRCFYDLVIEIAIVRPGPIQGGMVHPYLRRRAGEEEVSYPSADLQAVLHKTLGVPIFQEQVMKLSVVAAGFTPGEADLLRRAMGAWRRPGLIGHFEEKFLKGMEERGYDQNFAAAVFNQIKGFGEYGFPESHAASFALLTYVSLWLKRFEPAAFTCALLNSLPMGFYGPSQLIACARRHGVPLRPPDVCFSSWDSTLEERTHKKPTCAQDDPHLDPALYGAWGPALRLGLRLIKGLSRQSAARIVKARREAPFRSMEDCLRRAEPGPSEAAMLAEAGAFSSLTTHRREAWWRSAQDFHGVPLFSTEALTEDTPSLPEPDLRDLVLADYKRCGHSLKAHPMELIRPELEQLGVTHSRDLQNSTPRSPVTIAGLSICRQRPATASGVMFVTLEDEFGHINVILRVREQERFRKTLLNSNLLLMKGQVEKAAGVLHVMVGYVTDLPHLLSRLKTESRDFH